MEPKASAATAAAADGGTRGLRLFIVVIVE